MANQGGSWPDYDVHRGPLEQRVGSIKLGSQTLWDMAQVIFEEGQKNGWIKAG